MLKPTWVASAGSRGHGRWHLYRITAESPDGKFMRGVINCRRSVLLPSRFNLKHQRMFTKIGASRALIRNRNKNMCVMCLEVALRMAKGA